MIAAVSIARPLRAAIHAMGGRAGTVNGLIHHLRPDRACAVRVIHRLSTARRRGRGIPQAIRPAGSARSRGSIARTCPSKLVEDEPPADELRLGDDVRVRDAPRDLAVGLEREGLDLGLDEDVGQPRRAEDDEHRRRRAMAPAQLAGPGLERVDVEPVLEDEEALGVPQQARPGRR